MLGREEQVPARRDASCNSGGALELVLRDSDAVVKRKVVEKRQFETITGTTLCLGQET
jgi:hypothetical protein